jgi:hypothetical protein
MAWSAPNRAIWLTAAGFLALALLLGARLMPDTSYTFDFGEGRPAVSALKITVPQDQWERFFGDIKKFAERNTFEVRVAKPKPDKDLVFVDLWRPDMAISGGNVFEPQEFEIAFYIDPEKGGAPEVAAEVEQALKNAIASVPGAKVDSKE